MPGKIHNLRNSEFEDVKRPVPIDYIKAIPVTARGGSHIFWTVGSQMAVRVSTLRPTPPFTPRKIPDTHFC
jgi:hypothetical protein